MKKLLIISAFAATIGSVSAEVTREVRKVRVDAVNTLSRSLPCRFIDQQTLLDALNFIEQELDPKTHQELLKLQAEADALHQQREAMLQIPGIDATHSAIEYIDQELVKVEKRLDDLLYNGGFFHWKTMTALGAGAIYGSLGYHHKAYFVKGGNALESILVGFAVAVLLEWAIRGRRAVLAGNFATLAKFISSVATKFFGMVFGDGGYADRMIAAAEKALRAVGKQLDEVLDNPWVAGGIGIVTTAVVGGIFYSFGHAAGVKEARKEATVTTGAPAGVVSMEVVA